MRRERVEYFSIGLVCGLVFGVLAGLLLAPSSGAKTRRRLAYGARTVASRARLVAERAEHAAEMLGERAGHYLGRDEELAWRRVREIREGMRRLSETQTP